MVLIPGTGRPGPLQNDISAQSNGSTANTTFLLAANNLSDLTSVVQARINLGLGTAALAATTAFDAAGAAAAALAAAEAYARSLVSGGGSVTMFSAGALSPLFTTSVANSTTTPALSFALTNAPANSVLGNNTTSAAAPSYQNTMDLVTNTNAVSNVLLIQNASTGTAGATLFGIANSSSNLLSVVTSTGYTGAAIVTGGPTGTSANFYTQSTLPLCIGTNSVAALTISTSQTVTLPAYSTAGIITNTAAGLLTSLSNASSASSTLLGYLGSGSHSSTTYLRGDGTWATPSSGGTGTVTSITAGTGLTGGTITTSGTIALAAFTASINAVTNTSGTIVDSGNLFHLASYSSLQNAFNAACAAHGTLMLPAGTVSANLTLPSGFTGGVGIRGCGPGVSIISGSVQLISTGSTTPVLTLEGFTVTGGGLILDLSASGSVYAGGLTAGTVHNVNVLGVTSYSGDSHAFYFNNCGQMMVSNITGIGSNNTSFNGATVISSSNLSVTNACFYHYGKGLNIGSGPTGHFYNNFRVVDCQYGIYAVLGVNQGFFMSNWMVDNGNGPSTFSTPCVYLQGSGSGINACTLVSGEVLLQNGGSPQYAMQLYDMEHVMVSSIDFTFSQASTAQIHLTNSTSNCHITGCAPGTGTLCTADSGTSGTYCLNNIAGSTVLDNGSNHLTPS